MTQLAGSTHCFADLPLDEAVEEVLALGLDGIEISYSSDAEPKAWDRARSALGAREAPLVSLAFEESPSPAEIKKGVGLAASLGATVLVVGAPIWLSSERQAWEEQAGAAVASLLELVQEAADREITLALEIPRRETLAGDLDSYRQFSRLLVRHRVPLSVDSNEVAEVGLSVNELWRYFASRIAHVRLGSPPSDIVRPEENSGGELRVDLEQWARMGFAYGFPGVWVLRPDVGSASIEERRSILAGYRKVAEDALAKFARPAAAQ